MVLLLSRRLRACSSGSDGQFEVHTLSGDCTAVLLLDTQFVVVSFPTIAARPEEREFDRSNVIVVDGNIGAACSRRYDFIGSNQCSVNISPDVCPLPSSIPRDLLL